MNNKTTLFLALGTILVLAGVIGVGVIVSQPKPQPQPVQQSKAEPPKPSAQELDTQLTAELPIITSVITSMFPDIPKLYTINRGALYDRGQWYATTLTYAGNPAYSDQRDTLRLLLEKKDNTWTVRTNPPQPLLTTRDLPDVPKYILEALNKPAPLPAAGDSPAITPAQ